MALSAIGRPALLATSLCIAACAPSLRLTHRASAYFERCYAADIDARVPDADRRGCWQAWTRWYEIGASAERLYYVRERLAMLDPDRGAAISLATGDDASPDMIEGTDPPSEVADTPSEVAASSGASATETREPPQPPIPSEAAPPDGMLADRVRDERHARAHERHLHRGILAPSTHTPSCPCTSEWAACASTCLADEHGCIAACRREHHLCSRSCY